MKRLDDSQLQAFDTEYVDEDRWALVRKLIDADFPDGRFKVLDLGGGTGRFSDRLLAQFPECTTCVFDNSEQLLHRNIPHERKTIMCESVEKLGLLAERFDVVACHWLLHHLVGDSYRQSRDHQLRTLAAVAQRLTNRGRISIYENNFTGWLARDLPGRLIYHATSQTALAPLAKRMGANTAGVGVCFLSKEQWYGAINRAGLQILRYDEPDKWRWPVSWERRALLHIGSIRVGHYWLENPSARA